MKDSPNLDLLRSIAVGLVVVCHLGLSLGWARGYDLEFMGRVGVAIFFVHTSVVLMLSLERRAETAAQFLIRRFFRIYPLAVATVLLVSTANRLGGTEVDPWAVLSNVLLIQNITGHPSNPGPLWSLPFEVQMYLVLPLLYAVTKTNGLWRVALLLASSVALLAVLPAGAYALLRFAPCFLAGVLAFALGRRIQARVSAAWLFALVAGGAMAVTALAWRGVPETPLLWALCLALGLAIPLCRQFSYRPLAALARTVAKYSYSVYLTHMFPLLFGFALFPDLIPVLQFALFFAALAAWARVAYRCIEEPGIRLGARAAQVQMKTTGRALDAPAGGPPTSPAALK